VPDVSTRGRLWTIWAVKRLSKNVLAVPVRHRQVVVVVVKKTEHGATASRRRWWCRPVGCLALALPACLPACLPFFLTIFRAYRPENAARAASCRVQANRRLLQPWYHEYGWVHLTCKVGRVPARCSVLALVRLLLGIGCR
jgi:hypothetical protein